MRYAAALFATLVFAACSTTLAPRTQPAAPGQVLASEGQKAIDPSVQFLLGAAAADFHAHRSQYPARFRDVRIGHVMTPGGAKQYMLCGEFLPAQEDGTAEWVPFATVKTSGYEQWLGVQAANFCQHAPVVWDDEGDLSSSLQSRLDSTR